MTLIPTLPPSDYDETDSSAGALWPTPQAADAKMGPRTGYNKRGNLMLTAAVHEEGALWPTPDASSGNVSAPMEVDDVVMTPTGMRRLVRGADPEGNLAENSVSMNLGRAVHMWSAATWLARRERLKAQHINGNGAGLPLAIAVQAPEECAPVPSTSSMAGHRVSHLQRQVSALVRAIRAGDGPSSCALLASWHQSGYWASLQPALFPCDTQTGSRPLDEYSSSYPRWGTVAAGECGAPVMSALRIEESGCSSSQGEPTGWPTQWPTPTVPNGGRAPRGEMSPTGMTPEGIKRQVDLGHHMRMVEQEQWPTPNSVNRASRRALTHVEEQQGSRNHWSAPGLEQMAELAQGEIPRVYQASLWPTPAARDWKSGQASADTLERNSRPLNEVATAQETWPTPRAADAERTTDAGYSPERGQSLTGRLRPIKTGQGQLNPAFVESLMGFPRGWLDIPGRPVPAKRSTRTRHRASRTACRKGCKS